MVPLKQGEKKGYILEYEGGPYSVQRSIDGKEDVCEYGFSLQSCVCTSMTEQPSFSGLLASYFLKP